MPRLKGMIGTLASTSYAERFGIHSCISHRQFSALFYQDLFCSFDSRNIIQKRYDLTESDASTKASYLLVGSVFLYPIVGTLFKYTFPTDFPSD